MTPRRKRFTPAFSAGTEALETRVVLSAAGTAGVLSQGAADVAAPKGAGTRTTLTAGAGTLGQPITITATVRASASAGSPTGTVDLIDNGQVIQTLTLAPATSPNAGSAISQAAVTLTQPPGGAAFYFGKHQIDALYVPTGSFARSAAVKSFAVTQPAYTSLAGGVKVATIAPGTGPQIQSGQMANVLYTGYLKKTGQIFDDSRNDGGTPLSFTLGASQVVAGFDAGTAGMQAGESRIIVIPPAEGYGHTANGPIPANSTLIFVVTLESIT